MAALLAADELGVPSRRPHRAAQQPRPHRQSHPLAADGSAGVCAADRKAGKEDCGGIAEVGNAVMDLTWHGRLARAFAELNELGRYADRSNSSTATKLSSLRSRSLRSRSFAWSTEQRDGVPSRHWRDARAT